MIQGLHFDVSSDEMSKILGERIDQCNEKIKLFEMQAIAQEELAKQLGTSKDDDGIDMPKFSNDGAQSLRGKANEYKQKVKEYIFLQNHVIKGETYRLDRTDLNFLGIIQQRY